jgi:hypothetical protein
MLTNWFSKSFSLQSHAASICARSFIQSLKFAGLISTDEILRGGALAESSVDSAGDKATGHAVRGVNPDRGSGEQKFILRLDGSGNRNFVVISPATISRQELKRIQDWLSFQLIVEETQLNQS